jgi:hypothetical protein
VRPAPPPGCELPWSPWAPAPSGSGWRCPTCGPFFDFPAEHSIHLRSTNSIEATFLTVRLRTGVTKGAGFRAAGLAAVFKLIESAQQRWPTVNGPHLVALIRAGAVLDEGVLIERPNHRIRKPRATSGRSRSTGLDDSSSDSVRGHTPSVRLGIEPARELADDRSGEEGAPKPRATPWGPRVAGTAIIGKSRHCPVDSS